EPWPPAGAWSPDNASTSPVARARFSHSPRVYPPVAKSPAFLRFASAAAQSPETGDPDWGRTGSAETPPAAPRPALSHGSPQEQTTGRQSAPALGLRPRTRESTGC